MSLVLAWDEKLTWANKGCIILHKVQIKPILKKVPERRKDPMVIELNE
jgi:hypothetical protein